MKTKKEIKGKLFNIDFGKIKSLFLLTKNVKIEKGMIKKEVVSIRGIKSMSGNCGENERVITIKKSVIQILLPSGYTMFISVRVFKSKKVAQ